MDGAERSPGQLEPGVSSAASSTPPHPTPPHPINALHTHARARGRRQPASVSISWRELHPSVVDCRYLVKYFEVKLTQNMLKMFECHRMTS